MVFPRLLKIVLTIAMLAPTQGTIVRASLADQRQDAIGWATAEGVIVGGNNADAAHRFVVRNRDELSRALAAGGAVPHKKVLPIHIVVVGEIDLSVDERNVPLTEADYRDPAFTWEQYGKQFAPAVWGKVPVQGPAEDARKRSAEKQAQTVVLYVGSNTTLKGEQRARIKNGNLTVRDAENVIIQNITFEDAYDYFPHWDPKDNANGEWNAAYDNITLVNARRVWIDRCTFSDGARPDKLNRAMFGRPMQFHDGLVDIIRSSDLVTISNSHFKNHEKGMLIGNSDRREEDAGKLRVTLHHNWFENVSERSPRVRYGKVHVYNNLYTAHGKAEYRHVYFIGVGVQSQIFSQANVFEIDALLTARPYKWWRGDRIKAQSNLLNNAPHDGLASLKKDNPGVTVADHIDWTPPASVPVQDVSRVAQLVRTNAGAR